jgi:hypothetical protein
MVGSIVTGIGVGIASLEKKPEKKKVEIKRRGRNINTRNDVDGIFSLIL